MIRTLLLKFRLMAVFCCALPSMVSANAETCPTYNDILSLSLRESLDLVAPQMMDSCGDDAISTGLYGGLLLRAGAISDAVVWLEKSLLLDPDQRGVSADYALALSSLGDANSSRELASDLLGVEDIPESLSTVLDSLISSDQWLVGGQFSITGGYSDNIDYVAELSSLDLTFGEDGVTTLPLAQDSVATSASFIEQSVSLSGYYQTDWLSIQPSMSLSERRAAESEVSDYSAGHLGLRVGTGSSSVYFGLGSTDYGIGLDREDRRFGVSHGLSTDLGESTCRSGLTAELWQQRYSDLASFDADASRLGLWLACDSGWEVGLFLTQDDAVGQRIGGDRGGVEAQIRRTTPLQAGRLHLDISVSSERDSEGYSEFLARDDPRKLTTIRGAASWSVPLTQSLSVSTSLMILRQRSNLALFDMQANELSFSIDYVPN